MANRKERRFIQKERMKNAGCKRINDPSHYDGVNEQYRSFFAMHWRYFPKLDIVPIIKKHEIKHTKRNLRVKRKEAMA